jgi:uncharacterized protein YkwD
MKTIRISLITLCLAALFSCTKGDIDPDLGEGGSGGGNGGGGGGSTNSYNVNKPVMLQLINNVRQTGCDCGGVVMPPVPPVAWNDLLDLAAYRHSKDMFDNNYFSHTGLDGSSPGDRIRRVGYNWNAYGENIARGYPDEQSVMTGWLNSAGHCRNIMSANVNEVGMGREGNYWTQVFGRR